MEPPVHSLAALFDQLGLASDAASIERFMARARPIPVGVSLPDAPLWSEAQARFLREAVAADADWAEVVDQLDVSLRG